MIAAVVVVMSHPHLTVPSVAVAAAVRITTKSKSMLLLVTLINKQRLQYKSIIMELGKKILLIPNWINRNWHRL